MSKNDDLMNELGAKSASNGMMGGPGSGRTRGSGSSKQPLADGMSHADYSQHPGVRNKLEDAGDPSAEDEPHTRSFAQAVHWAPPKHENADGSGGEKVSNWGGSKPIRQQVEEKAKIVSDKALAHKEFKKLEKEKGRDHPDTQIALHKYIDLPELRDYKSKVK